RNRFFDRHVQYIGNRLALEAYLQGLAVVSLALTGFTRHMNIREKLHLDQAKSRTFTRFAAPTLHIQCKPSGLVPTDFGLRKLGEEVPDLREYACVRRGVRTRRSTDRGLIDFNDFVDVVESIDLLVRQRLPARIVEPLIENREQGIMDKRRLSAARHTRDAGERSQWNPEVDVLQVVTGRPLQHQRFSATGTALRRIRHL